MIGQLLAGRYLILETLGTGGFSETYLARDKYLPHYPLCVVKRLQLPPDSPISLEAAQQLFEREAKILGQLGQAHEQIPTLLAYCGDPEQVYLVQEYIEGENLASWISTGKRLTVAAAIALLFDLLPVLDYIHSCKVIHRDIKPDNLIYRHRDSKIVLIDFGAAGISPELAEADGGNLFRLVNAFRNAGIVPELAQPDRNSTAGALIIGTPGYMPDEQDDGQSQFNSDVYALGMLVIHLLTGVDPCQIQPDPISGELDWHCYLSDPTIDPRFLKILDQMVRVSWRDRYLHAADVLVALKSLTASTSISVNVLSQAMKRQWLPRPRQLGRRLRALAGGLLVAGTIGSAYFLVNHEQAKTLWMQWNLLADHSDTHLHKLYEIQLSAQLDQMLIAPNDRLLVTAAANQALQVWSLSSGALRQTLSGSTSKVTTLGMSRDSQLLVSGGQDGVVRLWQVDSGKLLRTFKGHPAPISAVAISADAKLVASGSQDGTVRLWNVSRGILERTLTIPDAAVTAVAYGANNRVISASSARADPTLNQIQVWQQQTGQLEQTLAGHTTKIVGLQALEAPLLLSMGADRTLLWNLQRAELAVGFPPDSGRSMAAVWRNQHLVTVHDNGSIRAWTDKTQAPLFKQVGKVNPSLAAKLSANQRYLVCWGADQRLRVWQMDPTQIANF
jgi:serine/threonine protein kinase